MSQETLEEAVGLGETVGHVFLATASAEAGRTWHPPGSSRAEVKGGWR